MTGVDGYFIDAGVSHRLVLPPADDLDRDEAAQRTAEVFSALSPLITPLSFEIVLMAYAGDDREPIALHDPLRFVVDRAAEQELGLEPGIQATSIHRVDRMTPDATRRLLDEIFASEQVGGEAVLTYEWLSTGGVEVELPAALRDRDVLAMGIPYDRRIDVGRRGDAAIVQAGRVGEVPPFHVMLRWGSRVEITTHWSLWTPGGPGVADLEAALGRLQAHGWRLVR